MKIGGGGGKKKKKQQASKFKQVRVRVEDRTTTHQGTYYRYVSALVSINSLASGIPTKLQHLISIHQPSTTNSISDSVQIYQANPISFNAFFSFSSRTESIANQTISYSTSYEPQQHVLQNTPKYHDNHHYKYRYLLSNSRSNRPANKTQHTPKPPTKKPPN